MKLQLLWEAESSRLTQFGGLLGTAYYLPPEALLSSKVESNLRKRIKRLKDDLAMANAQGRTKDAKIIKYKIKRLRKLYRKKQAKWEESGQEEKKHVPFPFSRERAMVHDPESMVGHFLTKHPGKSFFLDEIIECLTPYLNKLKENGYNTPNIEKFREATARLIDRGLITVKQGKLKRL